MSRSDNLHSLSEDKTHLWIQLIIKNNKYIKHIHDHSLETVYKIACHYTHTKIPFSIKDFAKCTIQNDLVGMLIWILFTDNINDTINYSEKYKDIFTSVTCTSWTALHILCSRNRNKFLIDKCIEQGCNINARTGMGCTPLTFVSGDQIHMSCTDILTFLLDKGADIDKETERGWTPLMLACRYSGGHSTEEIIRILLDRGADIDRKNGSGWTALMLAICNTNTHSSEATVKMLLDAGADPNLQNNSGQTALKVATIYQHTKIVNLLFIHTLLYFEKHIFVTECKLYQLMLDEMFKNKQSLYDTYSIALPNYLKFRTTYPKLQVTFSDFMDIPKDFNLDQHMTLLETYSKDRINPEDLALESWDQFIDPVICTNNYWYHIDELKQVRRCPFTNVPKSELQVKYSGYLKIGDIV